MLQKLLYCDRQTNRLPRSRPPEILDLLKKVEKSGRRETANEPAEEKDRQCFSGTGVVDIWRRHDPIRPSLLLRGALLKSEGQAPSGGHNRRSYKLGALMKSIDELRRRAGRYAQHFNLSALTMNPALANCGRDEAEAKSPILIKLSGAFPGGGA